MSNGFPMLGSVSLGVSVALRDGPSPVALREQRGSERDEDGEDLRS